MTKKKKSKQGGKRPGAGRKAFLDKPVKLLLTLEQQHVDKLDEYAERRTLQGRAAAVRSLIDGLDVWGRA